MGLRARRSRSRVGVGSSSRSSSWCSTRQVVRAIRLHYPVLCLRSGVGMLRGKRMSELVRVRVVRLLVSSERVCGCKRRVVVTLRGSLVAYWSVGGCCRAGRVKRRCWSWSGSCRRALDQRSGATSRAIGRLAVAHFEPGIKLGKDRVGRARGRDSTRRSFPNW